jgi:hypothetical protein
MDRLALRLSASFQFFTPVLKWHRWYNVYIVKNAKTLSADCGGGREQHLDNLRKIKNAPESDWLKGKPKIPRDGKVYRIICSLLVSET